MKTVIRISRDSRGTYWVHRRGRPSYVARDHADAHREAQLILQELGGEECAEIVDEVEGR